MKVSNFSFSFSAKSNNRSWMFFFPRLGGANLARVFEVDGVADGSPNVDGDFDGPADDVAGSSVEWKNEIINM